MRILVTGAAGYIARWAIPELRSRGHHVTGTDQTWPVPGHLEVDGWLSGDLINPEFFRSIFEKVEPDLVVHLAAQIGRVHSNTDVSRTIRRNAEMTAHVAKTCGETDTRLLYVSSSEVYGPQPLQTEFTLPTPINLYGVTKYWGEQLCTLYARRQTTVARLFMPYGPGSAPGPGQNAMHTMLWMAHHGMRFTLHRGTTRSWTWAGDTARALVLLAECEDLRGVVNVGRTEPEVDALALIAHVADLAGSLAYDLVDPPPDVTPHKRFTNDLLLSFGWRPAVDLAEGMNITFDYIRRYDRDGNWTGEPAVTR